MIQNIPQGVDYIRILPEIILSIFGMIIMVVDPLVDERHSQKIIGIIALGMTTVIITRGITWRLRGVMRCRVDAEPPRRAKPAIAASRRSQPASSPDAP